MSGRKLTSGQLRRASRQAEKIALAVQLLTEMCDPVVLAELVARLEQPSEPDGFPAGSGSGGAPSADQSSSVERAVIARSERTTTDPVRRAGERLFRDIAEIRRLAIDALRQRDVILNSHVVKGRQNSIPMCQACGKDVLPADGSLRGGYCVACRKAWDRLGTEVGLGDRDRPRFESARRQAREDGFVERFARDAFEPSQPVA